MELWGRGGVELQVLDQQKAVVGMEDGKGAGGTDPGSGAVEEICPEKKPAGRRVSFKPDERRDGPIELQERPPSGSDETDTATTATDTAAEGPDKYRGRSRSEVAPTAIERFAVTRERKWSVAIASFVAAIPAFLLGLTLGYPSNAILDLTGEATELPPAFFFTEEILSLFTVSLYVGGAEPTALVWVPC